MSNKPNILIILSDQLRRDALSVYGDSNIATSHIDELANQGVCFNNACSTYPLCVPFRYSLMTGKHAHTCMIPALGWRMSPSERTLADEFNESGYETCYLGKWHLYGGQINVKGYSGIEENNKPVPRSHQGRWQHWCGFDLRNAPFDTKYYINEDPTPHQIEGYQTDGLFDLAKIFIKDKRDKSKPFCCVVSVEPPHPPYEAPKELEEKWLSQTIKLPPNFMQKDVDRFQADRVKNGAVSFSQKELLRQRKIYYAMIENLDMNIGKIKDFLKKEELFDNTIIVIIADHGEMGGSHFLAEKQYPYEESIGIPFIISGPDIKQNRLDVPVCTEDLFPTLLGLAGLKPSSSCCGNDLSPLIKNNEYNLDRAGILLQFVWEPRRNMPFYKQIWRGFRSQQYKYTVLGDFETGLKPWQFFDLKNDPYEMENLIDNPEYKELINDHRKWMYERMQEIGDDEVKLIEKREGEAYGKYEYCKNYSSYLGNNIEAVV